MHAFVAAMMLLGLTAGGGGTVQEKGVLHLTFTESSPLGEPNSLLQRSGANGLPADTQSESKPYDVKQMWFEVFVPVTYRPDTPYGLVVWAGVAPVPAAWQETFTRYKLICVSAYPQNPAPAYARSRMPLDAVHNLRKLYNIDENRVYVAGFSAGAGTAAFLVRGFPEVFKGGYFLNGGMFYGVAKMDDGRYVATIDQYPPKWNGDIESVRKNVRLVLLRGMRDTLYTPYMDRSQYDALLLDGFERVEFVVVPELGHELCDKAWLARGIVLLDTMPPKKPPVTSPTKDAMPSPGQKAQAERLLATAQLRIADIRAQGKKADITWAETTQKFPKTTAEARRYLQRVIDEYPTTPAADKARRKLEMMDRITPGL